MTQVVHKHSYPETTVVCTLCLSEEEDRAHLLFDCPHQDDIESIYHVEGRHNLIDIFLRVNSKDWRQEEG